MSLDNINNKKNENIQQNNKSSLNQLYINSCESENNPMMNIINKNNEEILLQKEDNRCALFPIKKHDIWEMFKKHESTFWQTEEIDFSEDYNDFQKLSDPEKHFISHVLAFFAGSDILVMENINSNFLSEIQLQEAIAFLQMQNLIEQIHSETYSTLIDVLIKDEKKKNQLFNAIETIPTIKHKAKWCYDYMDQNIPFHIRLVAFAIVEGIFFSSSFCAIYYLKEKYPGKLNGLTFSNELIARDESLHTQFGILLYNKYCNNKLTQEKIYEMITRAVQIEKEFVEDSIPVNMLGMNAKLMVQYLEFMADRLLKQLNYKPLYNSKNPFAFMENISIETKANFFDRKVGEYSRSSAFNSEKKFIILKDGF